MTRRPTHREPADAVPEKRRRLLFTAAMLLLPLAVLGGIEGGLRLAGFGAEIPLFVEVPGYPAYLVPNPDVGRRYFAGASVVPGPPHDAFLREKPSGSFRIFVQGASSAAGFPYGHGGSFSRMLLQRLQPTYPDRHIEVVNTGIDAVSSYTLVDLSREIVAQRPDAVLIYAGHNEYYGALGVGSTESIGGIRVLVRLYLAVDELRLVQALRALWAGVSRGLTPEDAPAPTLMEEMVRERSIAYGSPLYRRGLAQYRANLTDLLCRYERAGVPVFVGTVASNERDQPPFVGYPAEAGDSLAWRRSFEAAVRQARSGAPAALDSLIRRDDTAALPYYARARLQDEAGRVEAARADYQAARDRDRLPFRAPEGINAIIREVAAACGAVVVETQAALAAASPGGIVGRELMLEHLHPNVDGYFRIADAFYEALLEAGLAGEGPHPVPAERARREVLVTALDSTLAAIHVRRLRNSWPFQPPGVTRPDTLRIATLTDSLALDVLRGERPWVQAVAALGARYEERGDDRSALRVALALVQEQPYAARPYLLAANLLVKLERPAAAFQYFQAADEREPSAEARRMMGHLLLRAGRPAEAVAPLEQALALAPADAGILYDLSVAYAATSRPAEARTTARRLLQVDPRHMGAHRLLARLTAGE